MTTAAQYHLALIQTQQERDRLQAELATVRKAVFPKTRTRTNWCCYCGRPCWGRACHAHRDLIQIENGAIA